MDRRDALKKLGMGGATILGASMVMSSPAFADSGTPTCRFTYTTPSTAAFTLTKSGNSDNVNLNISVSAPGGGCPCGGSPVLSYAFRGTVTGPAGTITIPAPAAWGASATYDSGNVKVGAPYDYDLAVGVRVECVTGGPTFVCRFTDATGQNISGSTSFTQSLTLASAASLPSC